VSQLLEDNAEAGLLILLMLYLVGWLALECSDWNRRRLEAIRRRATALERCRTGEHETAVHADDNNLLHDVCRWCGYSVLLGVVIKSAEAHHREGHFKGGWTP
jgi:hypothetical protein